MIFNSDSRTSIENKIMVTVVVIAYNVEKYIKKCIDSVLLQTTHMPYEILIIDDGSTDNTGIILNRFADEYGCIRVIHKKNEGSGYSRNEGIKNAKGEWIIFVDGDDFLDERAIESFEKYLDPEIDVCLGRIKVFLDGSDSTLVAMKDYANDDLVKKCKDGKECFVLLRRKNGTVDLGTKGIYRRAFLTGKNVYQKNYKRAQDSDWAVRMFKDAGKMRYNAYPYYCYRKGRTGSAVNLHSIEKAIGIAKMSREWIEIASEYSDDFGTELKEETLKRFWSFFVFYSTNLPKEENIKYCEYIDNSRDIYKGSHLRWWMVMLDILGAYNTSRIAFVMKKIKYSLKK